MKLLKNSQNFTPLHQGLFFGIETENEAPSDLMVEVVDATTNEVIATQQLRGVVSAEVNVAPYIERFAEYHPSHSSTGFGEAPTRACAIRVDGEMSDRVVVSTNKTLQTLPTVVTAMPSSRHISEGEVDELLLLVEEGDNIVANIETDRGGNLTIDYTTITGAVIMTMAAKDFDADTTAIDVEILRNGEHFITLHYTMKAKYKGGCRLAWISESGSIERYTFPIVVKRECKSKKCFVGTGEDRRMVRATSESELSLVSRYEPSAMVEALSHIISSERVWIEEKEECREVAVITSAVDYSLFGEPDCVEIVVLEGGREERMLW